MKYITTIILLVLLTPSFSFCQRNLFDTDINLLNERDAEMRWHFSMAEAAKSVVLSHSDDGAISITGCKKQDKLRKLPEAVIAIRLNKNLNYTIFYANILNKEGFA